MPGLDLRDRVAHNRHGSARPDWVCVTGLRVTGMDLRVRLESVQPGCARPAWGCAADAESSGDGMAGLGQFAMAEYEKSRGGPLTLATPCRPTGPQHRLTGLRCRVAVPGCGAGLPGCGADLPDRGADLPVCAAYRPVGAYRSADLCRRQTGLWCLPVCRPVPPADRPMVPTGLPGGPACGPHSRKTCGPRCQRKGQVSQGGAHPHPPCRTSVLPVRRGAEARGEGVSTRVPRHAGRAAGAGCRTHDAAPPPHGGGSVFGHGPVLRA